MQHHKYKPGDLVKVLPTQEGGYQTHVGKIARIKDINDPIYGPLSDPDGKPVYLIKNNRGRGYYREECLILLKNHD